KPLRDFSKNIKDELEGVKKKDYFYFLQRTLSALAKEFMLTLDKIEIKIDKVEDDILNHKTQIKNLSLIRKALLNVRKALVDNRNIMVDLQEGASKFLVPNRITHIYTDINQILDTEELFRDRLTSILNLYMSSLSNKMNNVMKSFTVIASLLLIPMLVSSIYGMNVRLPLQGNTNAFYTIMLFVLLLLSSVLNSSSIAGIIISFGWTIYGLMLYLVAYHHKSLDRSFLYEIGRLVFLIIIIQLPIQILQMTDTFLFTNANADARSGTFGMAGTSGIIDLPFASFLPTCDVLFPSVRPNPHVLHRDVVPVRLEQIRLPHRLKAVALLHQLQLSAAQFQGLFRHFP
ncbi:MAG: hypothetical protein IIB42_07290, partial [Candidatus Marinimicrobia bacterium]|nr:hypothetical protein [Candidatus Neomarinimicrobiota bacterium]